MTQTTRGQVRTVALVLLVAFGLALVLSSIGVFCFLTGDPILGCIVDTVSPF